ncbi:MAG: VWA domain-containing protein [Bacteroidales bacterium]
MKNPVKLIFLFFALALFSTCYMVKKSENYYGIETGSSKKIVYIIDISGSMEGKAETDLQGNVIATAGSKVGNAVGNKVGGTIGNVISKQTNNQLTKLGKAKKELMPSIRGLSEDTYFTIIVFENNIKQLSKQLMQATQTNKNLAVGYLEKLESGGGTNMSDALEEAFAIPEVETMFVLSDGEPNGGKIPSSQGILDALTKWNSSQKVKIHTIGLGEDCDKDFMKKMADANGGQFIDK